MRRAFAPQDYAGGTADFHAGIAVNGERLVKLFIDASATHTGRLPALPVLSLTCARAS